MIVMMFLFSSYLVLLLDIWKILTLSFSVSIELFISLAYFFTCKRSHLLNVLSLQPLVLTCNIL